jgi:hypothetical protein
MAMNEIEYHGQREVNGQLYYEDNMVVERTESKIEVDLQNLNSSDLTLKKRKSSF